jgi:hypothetical protein
MCGLLGPASYWARPAPVTQPDLFSPIRPDSPLTRPKSEFIPIKTICLNRIYRLLDSSLSVVI